MGRFRSRKQPKAQALIYVTDPSTGTFSAALSGITHTDSPGFVSTENPHAASNRGLKRLNKAIQYSAAQSETYRNRQISVLSRLQQKLQERQSTITNLERYLPQDRTLNISLPKARFGSIESALRPK